MFYDHCTAKAYVFLGTSSVPKSKQCFKTFAIPRLQFPIFRFIEISFQKVRFTKFSTKLPKNLSWDNIPSSHRRQLSNVKFLTEIFLKKGVLLTNTINMIRILQENTLGEIDMRKFINRKKAFLQFLIALKSFKSITWWLFRHGIQTNKFEMHVELFKRNCWYYLVKFLFGMVNFRLIKIWFWVKF